MVSLFKLGKISKCQNKHLIEIKFNKSNLNNILLTCKKLMDEIVSKTNYLVNKPIMCYAMCVKNLFTY